MFAQLTAGRLQLNGVVDCGAREMNFFSPQRLSENMSCFCEEIGT